MSDAGFDDVSFPLALGLGGSGGPVWQTEIVRLASGAEVRNSRWVGPRRRWDLASAVSSLAELALLTAFFDARRGRLRSFRFRDPTDFSSGMFGTEPTPQDQAIGTGDGDRTQFQLVKTYANGARVITKPVDASVVISLDGAPVSEGWQVSTLTGEVTFDTPPGTGVAVTAGFDFDCAVRFDTDALDLSFDTFGAGRVVSLPIIEVG